MTQRSPFVIDLSAQDRAVPEQRARAYTGSHHRVVRAKIVLRAADGLVMITEPYASAQRVFWVVDNASSHRGR